MSDTSGGNTAGVAGPRVGFPAIYNGPRTSFTKSSELSFQICSIQCFSFVRCYTYCNPKNTMIYKSDHFMSTNALVASCNQRLKSMRVFTRITPDLQYVRNVRKMQPSLKTTLTKHNSKICRVITLAFSGWLHLRLLCPKVLLAVLARGAWHGKGGYVLDIFDMNSIKLGFECWCFNNPIDVK